MPFSCRIDHLESTALRTLVPSSRSLGVFRFFRFFGLFGLLVCLFVGILVGIFICLFVGLFVRFLSIFRGLGAPNRLLFPVTAAVVATGIATAADAFAAAFAARTTATVGAVSTGRNGVVGAAVLGGHGGSGAAQGTEYLSARSLETFERHLRLQQAVFVEIDRPLEGQYPTQ